MNTHNTPTVHPSTPSGGSAELHAAVAELETYDRERLAFTDAGTAPVKSTRRLRWLEAVRNWVLSH